jgi:hypothetical protein
MDNTQVIQFPIKGINRTFSRSTQPEGTAYDMLNVRPADRTGRLRGGKRSGTSKVWTSSLHSEGIVLLDQVTLPVTPDLLTEDTLLFSEPFTYADGGLGTVGSANWQVRKDAVSSFPNSNYNATIDASAISVASNRLTDSPNVTDATTARYKGTALVLTTKYIIKCSIIDVPMPTPGDTQSVLFTFRMKSAGTFGDDSVSLNIVTATDDGITNYVQTVAFTDEIGDDMQFFGGGVTSTNYSLSSPVLLAENGQWDIEIHVNGDSFIATVNGVIRATCDGYTTNNTEVGFGIDFNGHFFGVTSMKLDDFLIYSGVEQDPDSTDETDRRRGSRRVGGGHRHSGCGRDIGLECPRPFRDPAGCVHDREILHRGRVQYRPA